MFKFNKDSLFKPTQYTPNKSPKDTKTILDKFGLQLREELSLQYHQSINPKIWMPDGKIKPDVKDHLLQIAKAFAEFCHLEDSQIQDIILTGGNANYNYTDLSDLDVHIIADYSKISHDESFTKEFMKDKKDLWTAKHPNTKVMGYPVELFVQDAAEAPHAGQGVFSLKNNDWVQMAEKIQVDPATNTQVEMDSEDFEIQIDNAIKNDSGLEAAKQIWADLAQLRKTIQTQGEFAEKNLVFKELRNKGYLNKLGSYIQRKEDEAFSLDEK